MAGRVSGGGGGGRDAQSVLEWVKGVEQKIAQKKPYDNNFEKQTITEYGEDFVYLTSRGVQLILA